MIEKRASLPRLSYMAPLGQVGREIVKPISRRIARLALIDCGRFQGY